MRSSSRKKKWLIMLTVITSALVIIGVFFGLRRRPLPIPGKAEKEEITSFIAGRDFIRMPVEERHRYMKELKRHGILPHMLEPKNEKERENFRRHMEMFKQERLKKFYAMSPAEQEKALQEAAEELQLERSLDRNHRKEASVDGGFQSHRKELEGLSPEDRARTIEFEKRLKTHMAKNHQPQEN